MALPYTPQESRNNPYARNNNPSLSYVHALLDAVRYKNTIIPNVAPVIAALALWAASVVLAHRSIGWSLGIDDKLIGILGGSLAMLLAFRSNRGFERYWKGAQLWTSLTTQTRNLSRLIWNGISCPDDISEQEKLQVMKMLLAVAIATKYALCGENALAHWELVRLLPPGYEGHSYRSSLVEITSAAATAVIDAQQVLLENGDTAASASIIMAEPSPDGNNTMSADVISVVQPVRRRAKSTTDRPRQIPPLILLRTRPYFGKRSTAHMAAPAISHHRKPRSTFSTSPLPSSIAAAVPLEAFTASAATAPDAPSPAAAGATSRHASEAPEIIGGGGLVINAPLDIIHRISAYIRRQRKNGLVDVEDNPSITSAIGSMIDAVSLFEQILYVPMPTYYDVLLKQILLAYFIMLPFQIVRNTGWLAVPVVMISALAYFGVDALADAVQDPFGTDESDLPIDYFLLKLQGDIESKSVLGAEIVLLCALVLT
ncbi:Bestrophin, RFP-TM, chloride channel-domain-containing protein [Geranomyces variabilis]|nr:Bestrophin, RFP-TM, chloride channel-domain-containing protein [Geranomyces variabilis]KAJ3137466.1 hypothetical protein HDU90_001867 [Geranomyces variabilis]